MIKRHTKAIRHAVDGMIWAFRTQPNYKIHFLLIGLSIFTGYVLKISQAEWVALLITALMGIIFETLNTSIEKMGDAVDSNFNSNIKISKDVSAAAMLLYSIGAIITAIAIFVPKILSLVF